MNYCLAWGLAVVFTSGAAIVSVTVKDRRMARRRATIVAAVASTIALASVVGNVIFDAVSPFGDSWAWTPPGLLGVAPVITAIVALMAVGMAPLRTHDETTFVRVLLVFGLGQVFLGTTNVSISVFAWGTTALLTWRELKRWSEHAGWSRVFFVYHAVSFGLFALGAIGLGMGLGPATSVSFMLAGVAIREGMVPAQGWFPRFVEHAPMAMVVAFSTPQLGTYVQLDRIGALEATSDHLLFAVLAAATAVLGALLGAVQTNARRAIAFLIISQTAASALGSCNASQLGWQGAALNWQVSALSTTGFVMTLAVLEARRGRIVLDSSPGNFAHTPRLACAFLILGFASVGFPLTLGFVAEDLLVQGTVGGHPILGVCMVVATGINGITVMRGFFRLFAGTHMYTGEPDLTLREQLIVSITVALLLVLGLAPGLVLTI